MPDSIIVGKGRRPSQGSNRPQHRVSIVAAFKKESEVAEQEKKHRESVGLVTPSSYDLQHAHDSSLQIVDSSKKRGKKKQKRRCTRRYFNLDLAKDELVECCLTHTMDTYNVHLNRVRGVNVLNLIVDKAKFEDITSSMAVHMIWACLSCVHHFLLRLDTGRSQWTKKRQAKRAMRTYVRVLQFFLPDMYDVIFNAIVTFIEKANLWRLEYLCIHLLKRLFYLTDERHGDSLVHILTVAESTSLTNMVAARQIIHVIHEIESDSDWTLLNENFVRKLLDMYNCSSTTISNQGFMYQPLRQILDMCIRNMSNFLNAHENCYVYKYFLAKATEEGISSDVLMEFGNLLDHIGYRFRTTCVDPTLTFKFLPDLITLIGSQDVLYSLLGHRLLHQLFDREENGVKLKEPIIFFFEIDFKIKLGEYNKAMEDLYKSYRESIQTTFISAVLTHRHYKIMLTHTFLSVALLVIAVPCAYTAAAAVCIAMALQGHALNDEYEFKVCHGIHATVMGIVSLVAYIHNAHIFYDYIVTIMEQRAKNAPHLNPPLKSAYKYALHHVLWNNPGLFFEHVNCRYGLMKCFLTERRKKLR